MSEDFPRVQLAEMVGQAQAAQTRRERLPVGLLALGVALFALGLPTARYFECMDWLWRLSGSGDAPHGLLGAPVLGLRALAGWSLETSAFFLSALFLSGAFVAIYRLLRGLRFAFGLSLVVALLSVFAPMSWLGGTLPIGYSAGLFGSACLAGSLFRTEQNHPFGYLWRASSWLVVAFLLAAENVWLLCPALWAVVERPKERDQGWLSGIGLLAVFGVALWVNLAMQGDPLSALRELLFHDGLGSPSLLARIGFWTLGLGVLWLGVIGLFVGQREPEESPPPTWAMVWVAVALAPMGTGGLEFGPTAAFLIPMAAVGLAEGLHRRLQSGPALKLAVSLLLVQAGLTTFQSTRLQRTDPDRAWVATASNALEPTDGVMSHSRSHAYLARFRFNLAALWAQDSTIQRSSLAGPRPNPDPAGPGELPERWVLDQWDPAEALSPQTARALWVQLERVPPSRWAVLGRSGLVRAGE